MYSKQCLWKINKFLASIILILWNLYYIILTLSIWIKAETDERCEIIFTSFSVVQRVQLNAFVVTGTQIAEEFKAISINIYLFTECRFWYAKTLLMQNAIFALDKRACYLCSIETAFLSRLEAFCMHFLISWWSVKHRHSWAIKVCNSLVIMFNVRFFILFNSDNLGKSILQSCMYLWWENSREKNEVVWNRFETSDFHAWATFLNYVNPFMRPSCFSLN